MRRKGRRAGRWHRDPVCLSALVGSVVRAAPEGTARPVTELVWRRAVGVDVAKRTRPFRLEKGVLWVKVGSSAWAQELSLLKGVLAARLSELGIEVSDVRFRVGKVEPLTRPPGSRVTIRERPKGAPLAKKVC